MIDQDLKETCNGDKTYGNSNRRTLGDRGSQGGKDHCEGNQDIERDNYSEETYTRGEQR